MPLSSIECGTVSVEEFYDQFIIPSEPCVIRGLGGSSVVALKNELLSAKLDATVLASPVFDGGMCFRLSDSDECKCVDVSRRSCGTPGRLERPGPRIPMSVADVIASVSGSASLSAPGCFYVDGGRNGERFTDALSDCPSLPNLVDLEVAFLRGKMGSNIWLGGFTETPCHFDATDTLSIQLFGSKLWELYRPETLELPDAPYVSQRQDTSGDTRYSVFWNYLSDAKTSHAEPLRVTLEPGEALYIPAGFWHRVKTSSLDSDLNCCMAVSHSYEPLYTRPREGQLKPGPRAMNLSRYLSVVDLRDG